MTRVEFLAEVARAAERARKRRRRQRTIAETSLDALAGAREANPMRGVQAARQVPRCGKIKKTDSKPCQSPRVRGGTRCWRHGGLRQVPDHPGNVKRLLGGVYTRQAAYRLEMKTMGENWNRLTIEEMREIQSKFVPEARSDMALLDRAARAYLARTEDHFTSWLQFIMEMRARRLLAY